MTSLPKPGKTYSPAEIISCCNYFGWRDLARRIADKHHYLGLLDFTAAHHCKELLGPLMAYQIERWVGGSVDEQYIARLHLSIAVCRIQGHDAADTYLSLPPTMEWGYGATGPSLTTNRRNI